MKKLLFSLSLLASLATFAEDNAIDASAQIFGVMPITTSAQNVIVSVPWVASGYDNADISVSNIIKTANLTVGDKVRVYNRTKGAFNVWELKDNEGLKYWDQVDTVGTNGVTPGVGADITTLPRGGALILMRKDEPSAAYTFYVYGQYCSTAAAATTMTAGTTNVPAYTLVAPPIVSGTYTLSGLNWSNTSDVPRGAQKGDTIQVGDTGYLYYLNSGTKKEPVTSGMDFGQFTSSWQSAPAINAGVGFWYVSRGGSPTITWAAN